MSELIIELSRLRFNSNVRTETFADNILQEANHRFEKVFQILLSDSFSAEILQDVYKRQGYILSAIVGVALLVIIFKIISSMMKEKVDFKKKAA